MNENETDPRPADASAESRPGEGESEQPTAVHPVTAQPAPQWGPPVSSAPQSGSPWQQPAGYPQHPGHGQPGDGQPGYGQPYPGGYAAQPAYGQPYPQQPAYPGAWSPAAAQTSPGAQPGQPHPGPGAEGEQPPIWAAAGGGGGGQPPWAQSVDQPPPRPGRGRKILATGAAAVLLALTAGGIGAVAALALDDDGGAPRTVQTGGSSVTRVVDRSSLSQIAAAVQDSVVSITTGGGEGSGVVLTADGFIVTNNHVVANASNVTVIFADGRKASASVVGTDPRTDLAVIRASGVSDLKAATFGSSSKIQVGDTVLAIGSPLGLEGSVTAGIISAKDRTIRAGGGGEGPSPFGGQQSGGATSMSGLLQTDAPINPGNSGGALVNTNGEVIGINSAIATQGQGSGNIGLGFAIPSDKAKQVAEDLMAGRKVSHPALGVSVADAENGGALVSSVAENSAAAKAGLQQGDVVTGMDGRTIGDSDDLVAAVQSGTVGQKMTIDFTRSGAKKQVTVTLAEAQ
jgi:putative serine protease PepD